METTKKEKKRAEFQLNLTLLIRKKALEFQLQKKTDQRGVILFGNGLA